MIEHIYLSISVTSYQENLVSPKKLRIWKCVRNSLEFKSLRKIEKITLMFDVDMIMLGLQNRAKLSTCMYDTIPYMQG